MTETKETKHIVMFKNLRLNMFDDQLFSPQVELATKGKKKGCYRFNWGAKFIFPPKDSAEGKALYAQARAAMKVAKDIKWGDKAEETKIKAANTPIQDGDDEEVTTFSAHKGAYFMSASKTVYGPKDGDEKDVPKRPFRIIGPRKVKNSDGEMKFPDVKPGSEIAPYSGSYVNVKVEFWGQPADSERGIPNRINATILAVQFAKDGESFGGGSARVNVDDEFDEEGDLDDMDDDLDDKKKVIDDDLDI